MTCADFRTLTTLYLSGELDKALAEVFDSHRELCSACARDLEAQRELDAILLRGILLQTVESAAVESYVRRKITAEAAAAGLCGASKIQLLARRWRSLVAVGSVAALLLIGLFAYRESSRARLMNLYTAVARDHHNEVVEQEPRTWATRSDEIKSLAEHRGFSPQLLTSLTPSGDHLERAKLCRLDGEVYLHLVYSDGSGEFSVFLVPRDNEKLGVPSPLAKVQENRDTRSIPSIRTAGVGSEYLASIQSDGLTATIVTDRSPQSAIDLARFIAKMI